MVIKTVIQGEILRVTRIVKYTLVMAFFYVILGFLTSQVINMVARLTFEDFFVIQLIPSAFLSMFMYGVMAYRSSSHNWQYACAVYVLGFLFSTAITSFILQELFIPPTLAFELPILLLSTVIGTLIGIRLRTKNNNKPTAAEFKR